MSVYPAINKLLRQQLMGKKFKDLQNLSYEDIDLDAKCKKWSEMSYISDETKEQFISQVFNYCRAEQDSMYMRATQEEFNQCYMDREWLWQIYYICSGKNYPHG
jgi:hypothetical protein|tara:strand:+ start:148 stop:459 length:312 start_codon:yes stop_codon:yes gene_type:complete